MPFHAYIANLHLPHLDYLCSTLVHSVQQNVKHEAKQPRNDTQQHQKEQYHVGCTASMSATD